MKNARISTILTLSLLLFSFFSAVPPIHADEPSLTPEVNWELRTFNFNLFEEWDHESYIFNYTGTYDDIFNYSFGYIDYWGFPDPQEVWIEENRSVTYQSNYSYFSNATYTGNFSMSASMTAYMVEVSYGSGSYLIWVAAKDGTLEFEYYLDEISYYREFYNDYYRKIDIILSMYNITTGELISSAPLIPIEENDTWSYLNNGSFFEGRKTHKYTNYNFSLPLMLTYQIYTTEDNERVAWAEMIDSSFIVFDDIDKNGFYSVGEQNTPDEFSMIESYEFQGLLTPLAMEVFGQLDYEWDGGNSSNEYEYKFPYDKSISELSNAIQFTPPTLSGNEMLYTIDWDIKYPEYPTDIYLPGKSFYIAEEALYADSSPANYSYGFEYSLESNRSDLDMVLEFPKVTNETAYNLTEGLGLCLPHYNFFLSSQAISERVLNVLTVPSYIFIFEMDGIDIAEVNMEQDKKYYTLYDYPEGNTTTFEAIGASVTKLVTDSIGEQALLTQKNIFLDLIYSVKDLDIVKSDSKLSNAFEYFSIETTNYPTWSGERFIHDPTFTTFFTTSPIEPQTPFEIGGYYGIPLVVSIVITTIVVIRKYKKKYNK